jgi:hypothetical protein
MATLKKVDGDFWVVDPNNKDGLSFRGLTYIIATSADLWGFIKLDLENCNEIWQGEDCEVRFVTNGNKMILYRK